jgi:phosphatidylserine/phosphatidylglycerophosphate/cardiolipin synthase-like enzyme
MNMYGLKLNREVGIIIDNKELANFVVEDIESVKKNEITTLDLTVTVIAFLISSAIFIKYRGRGKDKL